MKSPIEDLGSYLITNAPSDEPFVAGTNLFYGQIPESAGLSLALIDGASSPPESPSEVSDIDNPGVQLMVRGTLGGYKAAYALMAVAIETLHNVTNETINSTRYIRISKQTEPVCIGFDSTNRPILTCHLAIKRT